jgi:hypothetical protein
LEEAAGLRPSPFVAARAAPALEQPGPLELVAGLDLAAIVAGRRAPVGVEELAQEAAVSVDEAGAGEADELVGKARPRGIDAELVPGQRGFQEMPTPFTCTTPRPRRPLTRRSAR